jgi:hypothetical protein
MKVILTVFTLLTMCVMQAQVTVEILWKMGISDDDASATIQVGDMVRWIWDEPSMPHDVSSDDPDAPDDFGSEILTGMGQIYEYTFTTPAEIDYFCSIHSNMNGTITVLPNMSVEDRFVKNFSYYPSVVKDQLHLRSLVPVISYEIYNMEGKLVLSQKLNNLTKSDVDLTQFTQGTYVVKVISNTNQVTTFRIIKQ